MGCGTRAAWLFLAGKDLFWFSILRRSICCHSSSAVVAAPCVKKLLLPFLNINLFGDFNRDYIRTHRHIFKRRFTRAGLLGYHLKTKPAFFSSTYLPSRKPSEFDICPEMSSPDASVLYVRVGYSTTEEIDNRNIYTQVTYFAVQ